MQIVSIDIETTGLDRDRCQIIEFAAVIDDLSVPLEQIIPLKNLPKFHCYVQQEEYRGEPYALAMHSDKLYKLADQKKYPKEKFCKNEFLTLDISQWFTSQGMTKNRGDRFSITAAGKNFAAFDLQFINRLPMFDRHFNISSMVMDPGPMYAKRTDKKPPDMDTCAKRAGISEQMSVTHDAMNEALMVVELLRIKMIEGYIPDTSLKPLDGAKIA